MSVFSLFVRQRQVPALLEAMKLQFLLTRVLTVQLLAGHKVKVWAANTDDKKTISFFTI
jgi:hypothetical protein